MDNLNKVIMMLLYDDYLARDAVLTRLLQVGIKHGEWTDYESVRQAVCLVIETLQSMEKELHEKT